jgi:hypothetical protein
MVVLAAVCLALAAVPADGTSLQEEPRPAAVAPAGQGDRLPGGEGGGPGPMAPLGAMAASVAAAAQWVRRRVGEEMLRPVTAPGEMRVLFVSGHGSDATGTFDEMMRLLDIEDVGDLGVVQFDYRDVEPWDSHRKASQKAESSEIADGIATWLRAMSRASDEPIYLIGHSKGAVAIAELLARWDLRPEQAVPQVVGAALLDPPMAAGDHGLLQSLARGPLSPLPNDGGYRPHHCRAGLFDCHDTREHLGSSGGVEVMVFRNPGSAIANFGDDPLGLRVYEISDPDGGGWGPGAIVAAHGYPLRSPAVAACIADEMRRAGSCVWPIRISGER